MIARSYLFVPANRPERFDKAWNSGTDAVIVDLEDAVPGEGKSEARAAVAAWLSPERPVYVRINGVRTPWWEEDLAAVARPGLAGIVLPKAEDPADVEHIAAQLFEGARIIPIAETAVGIWNVLALTRAPRVERFAFGALDLQLDIGIEGDDEELLYARSRLVLASRVANLPAPIDGVTTGLDDQERLRADVERSRRLGFGGKLCIHPRQVQLVNQGFTPSARDVAWAKRVMAAVDETTGAIRLDGEMIDRPVIERARRILARATEGGNQ